MNIPIILTFNIAIIYNSGTCMSDPGRSANSWKYSSCKKNIQQIRGIFVFIHFYIVKMLISSYNNVPVWSWQHNNGSIIALNGHILIGTVLGSTY